MNEDEIKIKNNVILHKDNSLNRLDLSFLKHIELSEYKKSELLAYWIHDYAVYHDAERDFDVTKSGVFHRGDIIKLNLGNELYNILNQNIEKENIRLNNLLAKLDDLEEIPKSIQESISKEMKYIDQLSKSINKYEKESIVLINQITTISKQRIFFDVVLKNVRLSNESLDLIDKQIIKFFTK